MVQATCRQDGCSKASSFGYPGEEPICCCEHKTHGMQYISPSANIVKAHAEHVPRGLQHIPSTSHGLETPNGSSDHHGGGTRKGTVKCQHEGCAKAASFGFPGGERCFCSAHKRSGMQYIAGLAEHHRGGAGDALTHAMDHVPRGLDHRPMEEREPKHRSVIASGGPHCQTPGCLKAASYGWDNKTAVMCAHHKRPAMVYIRHPITHTEGRPERKAGSKHTIDPRKRHVPQGLEYIPSVSMDSDRVVHSDHPHCQHQGCTKAPSYGFEGQRGIFCFSHKRAGMSFLRHSSGKMLDPPDSSHAARDNPRHYSGCTDSNVTNNPSAAEKGNGARGDHQVRQNNQDSRTKEPGEAVIADILEARKCCEAILDRQEDFTVGAKYLVNILKHPDDDMYRCLKMSNRKFYTEVWLNAGMRSLFLALGFRPQSDRTVVLHPPTDEVLRGIARILQTLMTRTGKRVVEIPSLPQRSPAA